MSTTTDTLNALAAERDALLATIARFDDAAQDRKGVVGEWSIKNVLAHLAAQERIVATTTPERLRTRATPAAIAAVNQDAERGNAAHVAAAEHLTPAEQRSALAETRAALVELILALGDDTVARLNPWPSWPGTLGDYFVAVIAGHEREHREAIAAAAS